MGIALLAFLYFSPVTPPEEGKAATAESEAGELPEEGLSEDPDQQVEVALKQLKSGEVPPMQAILKIREVAENYPGNIKANFTLGVLSLQTAQYKNAVSRLSVVTKQDAENGEAWQLIARAQLKMGDTATARQSFARALEVVDEETGAKYKKELPELNIN
ncbi:MAG: tetratricopeptide repeat protein [Owenweeksia sp.]|nr:tetratricopeptide repeat protein [Owenweeksia sp.]